MCLEVWLLVHVRMWRLQGAWIFISNLALTILNTAAQSVHRHQLNLGYILDVPLQLLGHSQLFLCFIDPNSQMLSKMLLNKLWPVMSFVFPWGINRNAVSVCDCVNHMRDWLLWDYEQLVRRIAFFRSVTQTFWVTTVTAYVFFSEKKLVILIVHLLITTHQIYIF